MANMFYRNGRWVTAKEARKIRDERVEERRLKEERSKAAVLEAEKLSKKEVKEVVETIVESEEKLEEISEIESLRGKYLELYEKNVANNKKNDAEWIKKKINEFTN